MRTSSKPSKIKDRISVYKFWFDIGASWLTAPLVFVTLATLLYERIVLFRQLNFIHFFILTAVLGMFIFLLSGRLLSRVLLKKYYEYSALRNPFTAEKLTPKEIVCWKASILSTRMSLRFLEGQDAVAQGEKEQLESLLRRMQELIAIG